VANQKPSEEVRTPDPTERAPTILVVDDEAFVRLSLSDFLQQCGFGVIEAGTADEALGVIASQADEIDLVITDVRMPGQLDGLGLAQWARANKPELPVIICSGETKKTEITQTLRVDVPFFKKPYDLRQVVAEIWQTLSAKRPLSSSAAGAT
jgi:DNA-binding NtrC family response regulator